MNDFAKQRFEQIPTSTFNHDFQEFNDAVETHMKHTPNKTTENTDSYIKQRRWMGRKLFERYQERDNIREWDGQSER